MKNFFLLAAASQVQNIQIQSTAELGVGPTATASSSSSYPGQPYRSPYLEKVVKALSSNLNKQIPGQVPSEMDQLLCLFEAKEGTKEWTRLGCDKYKE
jgi:hypothetical protein